MHEMTSGFQICKQNPIQVMKILQLVIMYTFHAMEQDNVPDEIKVMSKEKSIFASRNIPDPFSVLIRKRKSLTKRMP